jgi:ABC-2 type transport system ATP-binding protein
MKLFQANKITKTYSNNSFSLKPMSFELEASKIVGIVGENGNGKTTLLRIIAGDLDFNQGEISYFGQDIDTVGWGEIKSKIAYIPQRIPKWYGSLKDNLLFQAAILGVKPNDAEDLINSLVEKLGLNDYIHLQWKEISTGYRLRFQLAKMLIGSPEILVLDEPIANLDINAQNKFLNDLRNIVSDKERAVTVVLSSQQLHEIENIADSVLFLKNGELIFEGGVNDIGKERLENEFEIKGELTEEQLKSFFENVEVTKIAKTFNVKVPLNLTSQEFLQTLLTENITIHYFRDISSSTRKLFNK